MGLSNLYLLQYNNYFNRKIKRLDSVSEYAARAVFILPNASFNPNDGVDATHVMNTAVDCDYLVVTDQASTVIESRWFVIEKTRQRNGQYKLTLHRDVVADYYEKILDSPCYVEKATLQPNDPFIFNKEGGGYNQIKKSETLLKDESKTKWLVAFISKKREQDFAFTSNIPVTPQITATSQSDWQYASFIGEGKLADISKITSTIRTTDSSYNKIYTGNYSKSQFIGNISKTLKKWNNDSYAINQRGSIYGTVNDSLLSQIYNAVPSQYYLTDFGYDSTVSSTYLDNLNGKIIKFADTGKTFKITVNKQEKSIDKSVLENSALYLQLKNSVLSHEVFEWREENNKDVFAYSVDGLNLSIALEEVSQVSLTYTLPKTSSALGKGLNDQPFDMIMCPYELDTGKVTDESLPYYSVIDSPGNYKAYAYINSAALDIMTQIASDTSLCYDLQLLPYYVPGDNISVDSTGALRIDNKTNVDIVGTQAGSVFFWYPTTSSFRNLIQLDEPVYVTEPKIQNECDNHRFVAPNYGSAFDFNVAMNGGLHSVEINCTYLPYQSYIHVNPTFGGLYGEDFNDQRGLICGGNYSLSAVSDAWRNYVTQNKNYNEIFDREIQNMEVNRSVQRSQELASVITGTIGGGVTGVMGGGVLSANPLSAVVGGAVGAGASLAGGLLDMSYSQRLYDEAKSYKTDMRNFNLGNIKALPTSLSKTSAYNIDNKYFPFIEYYTCTDEEKEALRNQIKYTGMTVMRTGYIREYLQPDYSYIQGKMIKILNLNDDYHLLRAISEEIGKGVYIK